MAFVEFPVEGNGQVYVEVSDDEADEGGLSRVGAGDRVVRAAEKTWDQALLGMRSAAEGALKQLRGIDPAPDEVEVNFGVSVNGKVGATIVSSGADAHLKVKVVWKKPAEEPASAG